MAQKQFRRALIAAALGLGVAASPAWAIIIVDSLTGLFGVTSEQTIRISILNASARGGIQPCVGILDVSGMKLAEVEGSMLLPGEGAFVDFDARSLGLTDPRQRLQLRAEVEVQPPDPQQPPDPGQPDPGQRRVRADDVILTLEVFDTATGKTAFTMPFTLGTQRVPEDGTR